MTPNFLQSKIKTKSFTIITLREKEEIAIVNIELFAIANQEVPLENRKLTFGKYFEFEDLEKSEYVVKITYRRAKNSL